MKKVLKSALFLIAGTFLYACSAEGPTKTVELATQGLYSASLSNNGEYSLIGSIQHGGSFWKNSLSERRFNWNHAQGDFTPLISVDIDPSGNYALTGGARTMVLWNMSTGQSEGFWNTPGDIRSTKLSNNGDYAIVGLDDQTARYFDVKNGGIKQTFRTGAVVRSVDVDDSGLLALTGDDKYQVILWDTSNGEIKHQWELSNRIASVTLSDDGRYAFGAAQLGNAKVWSTETGKELFSLSTGKLDSRNVTIGKAVFSPDNRYLLTGGISPDVKLISLSNGDVLREWSLELKDTLRPTGSSVLALAFGDQNSAYYAIGSNGMLNIFE
ncbi:WD40 repeat domain-containing protein [Marinomonas sp. 2405UD68-3]|uniref:WD40 repeat domain-containing protein n=1 Tax=Marinomonas sp. 2405UD68-3 TaxID=3391835 RepID=UPI0039C97923